MASQLFNAFAFTLGLTVADPDERDYRRDIHHGKRVRVFRTYLA